MRFARQAVTTVLIGVHEGDPAILNNIIKWSPNGFLLQSRCFSGFHLSQQTPMSAFYVFIDTEESRNGLRSATGSSMLNRDPVDLQIERS